MSSDLGQSLSELSLVQLGPPKAAAAEDAADTAFEQETVDALCRTIAALPSLLVVKVWGLTAEQAELVAMAGQRLDMQPQPADAQCLHLACQSECAGLHCITRSTCELDVNMPCLHFPFTWLCCWPCRDDRAYAELLPVNFDMRWLPKVMNVQDCAAAQ